MMHTCKNHWCQQSFEVTDEDLAFYDKISPIFNGKKELIPPPTQCPECRQQRRLMFWNDRKLYHRKCDRTGAQIISIYSQDKQCVVYSQKEWWGDAHDPLQYGQSFDFNRSFFAQFRDLLMVVPRMSLQQSQNENSDYTNYVSQLKNCYLLFASDFNQDCCYGIWNEHSKDCFDNFMIDSCEQAYESFFSNNIYHSRYIYSCSQCSNCSFLFDCRHCSDCFLCSGLRSKQYCIANVQYSKGEYEKMMNEFSIHSHTNLQLCRNRFDQLLREIVHSSRYQRGQVLDSTGDFLTDSQNCIDCYQLVRGKDCRYVFDAFELQSAQDCCYVMGECGYENCECFPMPFHSAFNLNSYTGSDLFYCDMCMNNCGHLFGCVGLKHQQYCILNKQYSQEDYEALVPKIIEKMRADGEWGEYFSPALSCFGYNETQASHYFPLTKEEVLSRGWKWHDEEEKKDQYLGPKYEIPDSIADVPDDITKQILLCEVTGKPYKIIPQELKFYREMGIPIPRKCPDQRHKERMALRNPRKLWNRNCMKCQKDIQTTYAPDRPEIVYCEECYLQSVY